MPVEEVSGEKLGGSEAWRLPSAQKAGEEVPKSTKPLMGSLSLALESCLGKW